MSKRFEDPYHDLDRPPAHVKVEYVGHGAAFQYKVTCQTCGASEATYSPTNASFMVKLHKAHNR